MSTTEWIEVAGPNGKPYYWNPTTDETSWELPDSNLRHDPLNFSESKRTANDIVSPKTRTMNNYNESLQEPTDKMEDGSWRKVVDNGEEYWWNIRTNETRWEVPASDTFTELSKEPDMRKGALRPRRSASATEKPKEWQAAPAIPPRHNRGRSDLSDVFNASGDHSSSLPSSVQEKTSPSRTFRSRMAGFKTALEHGTKFGPRLSSKAFEDWAERLKQLRKERGTDVGIREFLEELEISNPYDVQHKLNVKFHHDELRYSGLPEEWGEAQMQFGIPLHACPRVSVPGFAERIPAILVLLRKVLENLGGLRAEGIFRISPDALECQSVKERLNNGLGVKALEGCVDPHIAANLIKQFFRQLTPNLLNALTRDQVMEMSEYSTNEQFETGLGYLQEPSRSAFLWLLDLLASVAANEQSNRMTTKNLAIVLSPNLYSVGPEQTAMETLVLSQKIAELILRYLNWVSQSKPPKS